MGKNFGAVSCEPCKAFFRRNALKEHLICHFDNKCKLDVITRKFCSKCRLDKCLAIGMRREWILNDEERELKRLKTMTNKMQRNSLNNLINNEQNNEHGRNTTPYLSQETSRIENHISSASTSDTDFLCELLDDNNFTIDALNEHIVDIETSIDVNQFIDNIVINEFGDQTIATSTADDSLNSDNNCIQNTFTTFAVSDKVFDKVVEFEMSVIPIGRPIDTSKTSFNQMEMNLLIELLEATKLMGLPLRGTTIEINNTDDYYSIMGYKFDRAIRTLTRVVKGLSAFNTICEEDKILLLKYSSIQVIFLRSILYFNDTADCVRVQVMYSIIVFNPDHCNLANKNVIKLQQHIYMYLLQRYLQCKYGSDCEAKTRFLQLMNIIIDLNVLREVHKRNIEESAKISIPPLLEEVLDIKPVQQRQQYSLTLIRLSSLKLFRRQHRVLRSLSQALLHRTIKLVNNCVGNRFQIKHFL
ncbi:unnamed protein product [Medioppia subpectinata]|uniref:Nuclear receptor domain-containing protein n=1 Tax=Medioppia subpectinata TaxID=1979941 RepID=A0A7R9Q0T2_9ACAR|nr:unnamed protein product [Medioppia subpectinata]CAG2108303.1 unnamed protein product [Medioppia subpectinata]